MSKNKLLQEEYAKKLKEFKEALGKGGPNFGGFFQPKDPDTKEEKQDKIMVTVLEYKIYEEINKALKNEPLICVCCQVEISSSFSGKSLKDVCKT